MQTFNKKVIFNYKPSEEVFIKALEVTSKLGKLSVRLEDVFKDYKKVSRIFAFIESKYSSKIEGIYTTLFDVVNTGTITKQQKLIKPIVDELFKSKNLISYEKINELASTMNSKLDESKRWTKEFGIYQSKNDKKMKIYEPPKNKDLVNVLLKQAIEKNQKDQNIIEMLHSHIIFEKIHPFVDANGRLGRLLLQKSLSRLINFSNVIPLSWAFFTNLSDYYESFDIKKSEDINKSILRLLNIINKMYKSTKKFTINLKKYYSNNISFVLNSSFKMNQKFAEDILLTLQTKRIHIENKYKLNVRTIDKIFKIINKEMPFNFKRVNRNILYWNLTLEKEINKIFF